MLGDDFTNTLRRRIADAPFAMLRYETEFTPCTGITAVAKQERRHFGKGVMIAPWCSRLRREKPEHDPLKNGSVRRTGWKFSVNGRQCEVLASTDALVPVIFLDVEGRFWGGETPYDTPPEPPEDDSLATLKRDSLYFGLAVQELLRESGAPSNQFIWAADWETVPAMFLVRDRHNVSLTLHNTFDECLEGQAEEFGDIFSPFCAPLDPLGRSTEAKTALQIGLEIADVVTTVNRGFAYGMMAEPLQREVMAKHLQPFLTKVVGINNAGFAPLSDEMKSLSEMFQRDFEAGRRELFAMRDKMRNSLPDRVRSKAADKVILVTMGRRVSQKMHDVLIESLRDILRGEQEVRLLAVFATVHGDSQSPAILARIKALASDFPANVVYEERRLEYYSALMGAADYNCMPSLYEPHGGAYEGTVIPIARAVDGLAEQICARKPVGAAKALNDRWHVGDEDPTGFLFREEAVESASPAIQFGSLLNGTPFSSLFLAMRDSLTSTLREAVALRLDHQDDYARLVMAALKKQAGLSWQANLDGMLGLVTQARLARPVA